eukprot:1325167-Pyramimonas_sp.AAC.1
MSKRKASAMGLESVDEVVELMREICPEEYQEEVMSKIRENDIDGEVGIPCIGLGTRATSWTPVIYL